MSAPDVSPTLDAVLADFVGEVVAVRSAPDPVNPEMIRHWVDAFGDANPAYGFAAEAQISGRPAQIAPPTMLQAWTMPGYSPTVERDFPPRWGALLQTLEEWGYESIVATDCTQEYVRELVAGDRITQTEVVLDISDEKVTALGSGYFVTLQQTYTDERDDVVGRTEFRVLIYRAARSSRDGQPGATDRPPRPRPAVTHDNRFFFDGCAEGRLLVQQCSSCETLRNPPAAGCGVCASLDWEAIAVAGTGAVHTFTVIHHPRHAAFDYPLTIAVVDLDEGVRLLAAVNAEDAGRVTIGARVETEFFEAGPGLILPRFRVVAGGST